MPVNQGRISFCPSRNALDVRRRPLAFHDCRQQIVGEIRVSHHRLICTAYQYFLHAVAKRGQPTPYVLDGNGEFLFSHDHSSFSM